MKIKGIPYETIDLEALAPEGHPGSRGTATWRTARRATFGFGSSSTDRAISPTTGATRGTSFTCWRVRSCRSSRTGGSPSSRRACAIWCRTRPRPTARPPRAESGFSSWTELAQLLRRSPQTPPVGSRRRRASRSAPAQSTPRMAPSRPRRIRGHRDVLTLAGIRGPALRRRATRVTRNRVGFRRTSRPTRLRTVAPSAVLIRAPGRSSPGGPSLRYAVGGFGGVMTESRASRARLDASAVALRSSSAIWLACSSDPFIVLAISSIAEPRCCTPCFW